MSEVSAWYLFWTQEGTFLLPYFLVLSCELAYSLNCIFIGFMNLLPVAFHQNLYCSCSVLEYPPRCFKWSQFLCEEIRSHWFLCTVYSTGKNLWARALELRVKTITDFSLSETPTVGTKCAVEGAVAWGLLDLPLLVQNHHALWTGRRTVELPVV